VLVFEKFTPEHPKAPVGDVKSANKPIRCNTFISHRQRQQLQRRETMPFLSILNFDKTYYNFKQLI